MTTAIEAGKAFVSLGVKSTLDKDLRKSKHTLKKFAKMSAKLFAGVAAASIGIAAASLKKLIDKSNELGKLAGEIGVTTQELQKLEHVGRSVGLELEDMVGGIEELRIRLAEAQQDGTGPLAEMFKKLGLDAKDFIDLPIEEQIGIIADELNKLDETSRQFAADEIFGGDGRRLMNVFDMGSEGIRKMTEEAERLGLVLSKETREGLKSISDAQMDLELTWEGFIGSMASTYAEEMEMMVAFTRVALNDMGKMWNAYAHHTVSQMLDLVAGFNDAMTFGLWDNSYAERKRKEADAMLDEIGVDVGEEMVKQRERRKARKRAREAAKNAGKARDGWLYNQDEIDEFNDNKIKPDPRGAPGTTVPTYEEVMNAENGWFTSMIPENVLPTGSVTTAMSSVGSFVGGAGVGQGVSQVIEVGERQLEEQKKTNEKLDEMNRRADMNNGGGNIFQGGV